jgi:hypothetical protein
MPETAMSCQLSLPSILLVSQIATLWSLNHSECLPSNGEGVTGALSVLRDSARVAQKLFQSRISLC